MWATDESRLWTPADPWEMASSPFILLESNLLRPSFEYKHSTVPEGSPNPACYSKIAEYCRTWRRVGVTTKARSIESFRGNSVDHYYNFESHKLFYKNIIIHPKFNFFILLGSVVVLHEITYFFNYSNYQSGVQRITEKFTRA